LSTQAYHSGEPSAGLTGAVFPGAGVPSDEGAAAADGEPAAGASGDGGEHAAMMKAAANGTIVSKKRMGNETFANA
jgi:hypothetical protein